MHFFLHKAIVLIIHFSLYNEENGYKRDTDSSLKGKTTVHKEHIIPTIKLLLRTMPVSVLLKS